MYYSKFTGNAQHRIRLKRAVRRTIHNNNNNNNNNTYRENRTFYVYVGLAPIICILHDRIVKKGVSFLHGNVSIITSTDLHVISMNVILPPRQREG